MAIVSIRIAVAVFDIQMESSEEASINPLKFYRVCIRKEIFK